MGGVRKEGERRGKRGRGGEKGGRKQGVSEEAGVNRGGE